MGLPQGSIIEEIEHNYMDVQMNARAARRICINNLHYATQPNARSSICQKRPSATVSYA